MVKEKGREGTEWGRSVKVSINNRKETQVGPKTQENETNHDKGNVHDDKKHTTSGPSRTLKDITKV